MIKDNHRATWIKSTFCGQSNGCVEIARIGDRILVRDSKLGDASPILEFDTHEWANFIAGIKTGQLH